MRLFYALWPEEGTRAQLAHWRDALHRKTGGRPMQTEDLHLTLCFLGEVHDARFEAVAAAAANVAARRFTLCIDTPSLWKNNRIVWAGPQETPPSLGQLVAELRESLIGAAIGFDTKAFVPHITLIRDATTDFHLADLPAIEWQVDRYALIKSVAGQKPRYEVAAQWIAASLRSSR